MKLRDLIQSQIRIDVVLIKTILMTYTNKKKSFDSNKLDIIYNDYRNRIEKAMK